MGNACEASALVYIELATHPQSVYLMAYNNCPKKNTRNYNQL